MATILVVDDELGIRALLSEILADEGHSVELAENAAQARACRDRMRPDLVLLDIWMPDVDGITLLKEWGASALLTMPVIMMRRALAPHSLSSVMPSTSGIQMSSRTRSGRMRSRQARAWAAFSARSTL